MRKIYKMAVSMMMLLSFTACSGGDDDSNNTPGTQTGVFLDSPVGGIHYNTDTIKDGTTNQDGEFSYLNGETITFSIGDIELPSTLAKDTITPLDLVVGAKDVEDPAVTNIARLLQSLDEDGITSNGITISDVAHASASGMLIDFAADTFDNDVESLVVNSGSVTTELVDASTARTHVENTIKRSEPGSISGYWSVYATDSDGEGKVEDWEIIQSGETLTINNSCETDDYQRTGIISGDNIAISWEETDTDGGQVSLEGTFDREKAITGTYIDENDSNVWRADKVSVPECPVVGNTYKVYGSDISWFDIASAEGVEAHIVGYEAADYLDSGLTFLGESTSTETFTGSHSYYLVVVKSTNLVYLNAITGSNGSSFVGQFNFTGNIDNHSICSNDDSIACEMGNSGYDQGSYIGITATGDGLTSITVNIGVAL